jgi:hypothetical protein
MRIDGKPTPSKLPKGVAFQELIQTLAVGQFLHKVGLAGEKIKKKKDRS